jgi:hypothetical protein
MFQIKCKGSSSGFALGNKSPGARGVVKELSHMSINPRILPGSFFVNIAGLAGKLLDCLSSEKKGGLSESLIPCTRNRQIIFTPHSFYVHK